MRPSHLALAALLSTVAVPAFAQTSPVTGARPGHSPGDGVSLPLSNQASNINPSSSIAPTLPSPGLPEGSPARSYLMSAQRALRAGQTGAAQQSLEMAETRMLDRSVAPSEVNDASMRPAVTQIAEARRALGAGDRSGAEQIISGLLTQ